MLDSGTLVGNAKLGAGRGAAADWKLGSGGSRGAAGEMPAAPIDFAHLRRYTLGDASLEREVLELFCTHAPAVMGELKAAASEKAWRDAAHSLKGSALSLGALRVARGAEQAEAASTRYGEASDILARLERAIDEVRQYVAALNLEA